MQRISTANALRSGESNGSTTGSVGSVDTGKFLLGLGILIVVVSVIVVLIVVIWYQPPEIVFTSSSSSSSSTSSSSLSPVVPSPGTGVAGVFCNEPNQCATGLYCSGQSVCTVGTAGLEGDSCATNAGCLLGFYCNGLSQCVDVAPAATGAACNVNGDCTATDICSSGVCEEFLGGTPSACTEVPMYRQLQVASSTSVWQLVDVTVPPTTAGIGGHPGWPSTLPTWFGCSQTGSDKVALYQWTDATSGDFVLSRSASQPFATASPTYTLVNGSTPLLYVYTSRVTAAMVPLLLLTAANPAEPTNVFGYHTSFAGNPPAIITAGSTVYVADSNVPSITGQPTGFLGYVLIT